MTISNKRVSILAMRVRRNQQQIGYSLQPFTRCCDPRLRCRLQCDRDARALFNGEFGNSRGASLHAGDAKSRFPKRMACALRGRNSSRMAIQV